MRQNGLLPEHLLDSYGMIRGFGFGAAGVSGLRSWDLGLLLGVCSRLASVSHTALAVDPKAAADPGFEA